MKNRSSDLSNAAAVKSFVQGYLEQQATVKPVSDDSLKRTAFVQGFAEFLIKKGFVFRGSWDTELQMLVFSSTPASNFKDILNIRHEDGLHPICYWVKGGGRQNRSFNDMQVENATEWYERAFKEYRA